jgi:hypothetical protein
MCKGKVWKFKEVTETKIHIFHTFLSYKIDTQKLKAKIMKQGNNTNTIEL